MKRNDRGSFLSLASSLIFLDSVAILRSNITQGLYVNVIPPINVTSNWKANHQTAHSGKKVLAPLIFHLFALSTTKYCLRHWNIPFNLNHEWEGLQTSVSWKHRPKSLRTPDIGLWSQKFWLSKLSIAIKVQVQSCMHSKQEEDRQWQCVIRESL